MRDYNELPDDEVVARMEAARKRAKEQLLDVGVPEVQPEDRLCQHTFNIDGKFVYLTVSDRTLVNALQNHEDLMKAAEVLIANRKRLFFRGELTDEENALALRVTQIFVNLRRNK